MEFVADSDTNYSLCARNDPKGLARGLEKVGNWRTNRDHPNYSIIKIGQNTEMKSSDLRWFAVSLTPVKDYQLTLMEKKNSRGVK